MYRTETVFIQKQKKKTKLKKNRKEKYRVLIPALATSDPLQLDFHNMIILLNGNILSIYHFHMKR